jgi:hypothetical protein
MRGRSQMVLATSAVLLVLSGVAGCGNGASSAGSEGGGSAAGPAKSAAGEKAFGPAADRGVAAPAEQSASLQTGNGILPNLTKTGPRIIKTGQLSVVVEHGKFEPALAKAQDITTKYGGYVVSTAIGGDRQQFAEIELRVPAGRFGPVMSALARRLGTVDREEIQGRDVTAQFIDLAARERNLKAQERVLLRLMNRAATVTDTIRVQEQLSPVQGAIEQIEGQLRYLRNQAAFSTITVNLHEKGKPAPGQRSAIGQAFRDAGDRALGVVTAVIEGAGFVIPTALIAALGLLVAWRLWRRFGDRGAAPATGAP